jgi:hypothetical protein
VIKCIVYSVIIWIISIIIPIEGTLDFRSIEIPSGNVSKNGPKKRFICVQDTSSRQHILFGSNDNKQIFLIVFKFLVCFIVPYVIIIYFSVLLIKFLKNWHRWSNFYERAIVTYSCNRETIELTDHYNGDDDISIKSEGVVQSKLFKRHHLGIYRKTKQYKIKRISIIFILAVVFSFILTWMPFWIYQILNLLDYQISMESNFIVSNYTLIIVHLGGIINPLLFMLLTKNFRQNFISIFFKRKSSV